MAKKYPIGIDMNDQCLTAAQVRKTPKGSRVCRLFCHPLSGTAPGDDEEMVTALKTVLSCRLFKGRRAVINLPFHDLSIFPLRFPLSEGDDPERAILQETLKFLPYPAEEAIIDYPSIMYNSGSCDATVVAVRRSITERWMDIVNRAGLTAEVIESSASALIRLHWTLFSPSNHSDLLCHIGRTHSLMAVLNAEGLLHISEISWGMQPLWEKLQSQFDLPDSAEEAMALLKGYGLAYGQRAAAGDDMPKANQPNADNMDMYRAIFQILAPAVDELVYECHKTISYLRSFPERATIGQLYLYGLAGLIFHLDRYLEKQTGIPSQVVDVLQLLRFNGSGSSAHLPEGISPVAALGLAMREISWL